MEFHWWYVAIYIVVGALLAVSNGWFEFIKDPGDDPGLFMAALFWPIGIPIILSIQGHEFLKAKKGKRRLRVAHEEKIRTLQEKEIEKILLEDDLQDRRNHSISAR